MVYHLECLNPQNRMESPAPLGLANPRVSGLAGKNIGIIWCGKSGGEKFLDIVAGLIARRVPASSTLKFTWGVCPARQIIQKIDTFIYGVGDSGIGAWESISRTIALEKLGKPGVALLCDQLVQNARASAYAQAMPAVRTVSVPAMEYYPARISAKRIRPVAEKVIDAILDALTRPLTEQETSPEPELKPEFPEIIKISASNYELACEKFNALFLKNHWGDGLPLVPPTRNAVSRMLAATTRSPQELIGMLPSPDGLSKLGKVTVEKIAVSAVLAGARPEYLPVIIAAMECLTDRDYSPHVLTSEGSFTIVIAITGPIAKKIDINSGIGLFGHGWRANNTIGRAVRLCLINLGCLWPGEYDMALIGRPSSHTFYVFAENDGYHPWEPYHVTRGYRPQDSCVTVSTVGGHGSIAMKIYGGGTVVPWTADSILKQIIRDVAASRKMFAGYQAGVGSGLDGQPKNYIFILHPEMAGQLKQMGFTGKSLQNFILERTAVRYDDLSRDEIEGLLNRMADSGEVFFGAGAIPRNRIPVFKAALERHGSIPVVVSPHDINIFVSGGISGYTFGMSYLRGAHQTRLIR